MTELIPRLSIGNWHEARDARGFYIITVAIDYKFVGHRHFHLIDGPGNTKEIFDAAVEEVCDAYGKGENVLVHCVGGRSRSAAVIVAAAVKLTGRPLCEVYDELLRKYDCVRIHPYLAILLLDYVK